MKISTQSFPNVYQSELYREYERKAFKNGMIDKEKLILNSVAEKISIKKQGSVKIDLKPSGSLENDILRLADGLRKKGYDENAECIEQNFMMFKKAESEFYNLNLESPEDFLNASHDALDQGDLHFHTIQEISKQINQVSQKNPKGKESVASLAKKILKKGQDIDSDSIEKPKPFQPAIDNWNTFVEVLKTETSTLISNKGTNQFNLESLANDEVLKKFVLMLSKNNTTESEGSVKTKASNIKNLSEILGANVKTGFFIPVQGIVTNAEKIKEIFGNLFSINWDLLNIQKNIQKLGEVFDKGFSTDKGYEAIISFLNQNDISVTSVDSIPGCNTGAYTVTQTNIGVIAQYIANTISSKLKLQLQAYCSSFLNTIALANVDLRKEAINFVNGFQTFKIKNEELPEQINEITNLKNYEGTQKLLSEKYISFEKFTNNDLIKLILSDEELKNIQTKITQNKRDFQTNIASLEGGIVDISPYSRKFTDVINTLATINANAQSKKDLAEKIDLQIKTLQKGRNDLVNMQEGNLGQKFKTKQAFDGYLKKQDYNSGEDLMKDLDNIVTIAKKYAGTQEGK
jgi:hypothetical protein